MQLTAGIALLGHGTVGSAVARRLRDGSENIERRTGVRCSLIGIATRRSGDALALIDDPRVDVVVESVGGTGAAAEYVERALDRGRHVVTANKDLIATQGPRLLALAASRGVALRYEAAACSALPVVRTIGEALAGDRVTSVAGVLNGTTTFILSAMEEGASYPQALAQAQADGYAESDPSSDVDGHDAAHKLALLVQLAFESAIISPRIRKTGIAGVARDDVERAKALGFRIRLIAAAVRSARGAYAQVAPLLVPLDHPFAKTRGVENVVRIGARDSGTLWLGGLGAGGAASAAPILGDLISLLGDVREGRTRRAHPTLRLEPAIEVAPLFDRLDSLAALSHLPVWNERIVSDDCYSAP